MERIINVNDLNLYKDKFAELVMNEQKNLIKCLEYRKCYGKFSATTCDACPFIITDSTGANNCIQPSDFPFSVDCINIDGDYTCDGFDYGTISDEIEAIKDKVDKYIAEWKENNLQEAQDTFDTMLMEYKEQNDPKTVAIDETYPSKTSENDVDIKSSNVISLDDSLDEYVIEYNDRYKITHTEDGKIILKRKIIYPKTIGECYQIMGMDCTNFNFSENPSDEECEIYDKLALLRNIIVARNAYWKRLNWKPDWDDVSQVKYCVTHSASTANTLQYYQTTWIKSVIYMPDPVSRQEFCDKFSAIINKVIEFI